MIRRFAIVTLLLIILSASSAFADNVSAKITIVQTNSNGMRFFFGAQGLSLFTTSAEHRELLLGAFLRKTNVDAGFTKIACPGGITGTCGTVTFVSVAAANIP
jgi:hypothetical protein